MLDHRGTSHNSLGLHNDTTQLEMLERVCGERGITLLYDKSIKGIMFSHNLKAVFINADAFNEDLYEAIKLLASKN